LKRLIAKRYSSLDVLQTYSGKILADRRQEKYISIELNLKKSSLKSEKFSQQKGSLRSKKALKSALYQS
jgi:hypothetical protein